MSKVLDKPGGEQISTLSDSEIASEEVVQELLEKYDKESQVRKFKPKSKTGLLVSAIAISFSLFHLWVAGIGTLEAIKLRSIHLTFVMVLIFLLYPARKKGMRGKPGIFDWIMIALSIVAGLYMVFANEQLALRGGLPINRDYIMGALGILVVFEAGRRCLGKELPILGVLFLLYAYFGEYIPGSFGHSGFSLKRIIYQMYLGSEGIFGVALGVSATFIFLFILFGAFLGETGMAKLINDSSMALAGTSPGGPAKVAVFASGIMGTISGSAVANVATTGAFTIPLMKSIGYRPHFAAAVEAVASTGGQFMPPIMGAAAFIMAEFLNIPYKDIMVAALIPAFLYYLAVFTMVHLEALKTGLKGVPREQLPVMKLVLKERGHLIIPLAAIIYLLVKGVTPTYAAFYGILVAIGASFLRKSTRMSWRGFLMALEMGAKGSISVAIATAVVGVIVGVSSLTSLGITLGDNMLAFAHGNLFPTLLLTMITAIILGMGMPTTAVYIVGATIASPALLKLGVAPLAAHLFVFYFGNISNVTPPVALAAFTGAGIASANPSKVGWAAARLAAAGFLIPYIWIYSPALIAQGSIGHILGSLVTATVGVIALACAVQGYMLNTTNLFQRVFLIIAAFGLIKPGLLTDTVGISVLVIVFLWQRIQRKSVKTEGVNVT
ncbi:TRAP transporter, 4TM/12TM fusion protein [Desulfosporosinus orientis DSM 765]|uniref:TRAP transporter, 4TM/12TM fusion protein n=1 Tax=Desulfosporosinus orientis (strain ATCC 19365 / DSM 765 / NCIMB 8382 / VKM B-1628 / Singapore I) TaxID=768706 RepID=G7WCW3_DESOD|nr:TRAP transporter permease [Desulfosporosinus orientis]AET66869.1 TRAP transporter, 4TM/12TM fusion protein [Desulfosporosinus orientis DSM 765]